MTSERQSHAKGSGRLFAWIIPLAAAVTIIGGGGLLGWGDRLFGSKEVKPRPIPATSGPWTLHVEEGAPMRVSELGLVCSLEVGAIGDEVFGTIHLAAEGYENVSAVLHDNSGWPIYMNGPRGRIEINRASRDNIEQGVDLVVSIQD